MDDKVIANIIGGVGNQMFQYAMAYSCAKRSSLPLLLDISAFGEYDLRNFELNKFNLNLAYANPDNFEHLKKKHIFKKTFYKDKYHFNSKCLKTKHSVYFRGFWQSEKYFCDFREDILKLFTFKNLDFIKNDALLNDIISSNSVSIHVRLGDYLNDEETRKKYFICTQNYYKNAINYINQNTSDAMYFVFSDDIKGAENILPRGFNYIFANTSGWMEDMYLMQHTRHNIIPNSSFSWWCAWLNKNKGKIVVAPGRWYSKIDKTNYSDVVPDSWVKVSVD